VTGEKIDDPYFQNLHKLRNDTAKQERNGSSASLVQMRMQSNDGCEPMVNDKTSGYASGDGCESLINNTAKR